MRIITGKARGLKLKTPKGMLTRPTSDRVKESLFSILNGMIDFNDKHVLDLFAGTGALGLEALSRGAVNAVFVDNATTDIIKFNVANAHFENNIEIIRGDVLKIIDKISKQQQFDLIFCDPPYNKGFWQKTLTAIDKLNLLKSNGLLIIEHGIDEMPIKTNFESIRQIKYGHTTCMDIWRKHE